jgi:hypothetical protein
VGEKETAYINKLKINVNHLCFRYLLQLLKNGLTAEVIDGLEELATLADKIKGKIVFYNRPMDPETLQRLNRIVVV